MQTWNLTETTHHLTVLMIVLQWIWIYIQYIRISWDYKLFKPLQSWYHFTHPLNLRPVVFNSWFHAVLLYSTLMVKRFDYIPIHFYPSSLYILAIPFSGSIFHTEVIEISFDMIFWKDFRKCGQTAAAVKMLCNKKCVRQMRISQLLKWTCL